MSNKYRSSFEKEARIKKTLKIVGIAFAIAVVLAIAAGIVASNIASRHGPVHYTELRQTLVKDYERDPWDGGDKKGAETKNGEIWAFYEALMCIEDDGTKNGSEGIQYDPYAGDAFCADLSGVEDETLRTSISAFLADYADRKGLEFRTGSLDELRAEGKLDASGTYADGVVFRVTHAEWSEKDEVFSSEIFIHYSDRNGKGATVKSVRKDYFETNRELFFENVQSTVEDGGWVCYIESTMQS